MIRKLLDEFWTLVVDKKLKGKEPLVLAIQLRIEVNVDKPEIYNRGGIIRSISTIDLVKKNDLNTIKDVYCDL